MTVITLSIACMVLLVGCIFLIVQFFKQRRELIRTQGMLESERLKKEVLRKESNLAFQMKDDLGKKLDETSNTIKMMESDILLLQKDNEETESLLQTTQPELYQLKMKLIEANNTIARLKGQMNQK